MADARRGVAAKSAALRTLHRRVKDLWKFLGCGAGGGGYTTSAGGHWPPDRGENASPLSLSLSSLSMYSEHGVKDTRRCFNSIFRYYPKERGNLDGPS